MSWVPVQIETLKKLREKPPNETDKIWPKIQVQPIKTSTKLMFTHQDSTEKDRSESNSHTLTLNELILTEALKTTQQTTANKQLLHYTLFVIWERLYLAHRGNILAPIKNRYFFLSFTIVEL